MGKKPNTKANTAKHLRLPVWLIKAVEERGRPERRTFSVQLAYELEQIPYYRERKPKE